MWKFLLKRKATPINGSTAESAPNIVIGWSDFDNQKSISTKGSENGLIILDIEHSDGARITLEKDSGDIPFAITTGIYGLMFHTTYASSREQAVTFIETIKSITETIFELLETPENERDQKWNHRCNELIDQIVMVDAI